MNKTEKFEVIIIIILIAVFGGTLIYARGVDKDPRNPLIREVGWNYLKRKLRSHPKVAERFYSDVFDPSNADNPVKIPY